ncbi:MAG: CAP domain-containing protein [Thermoanaerobaculia bacterium]
MALLTCVLVSAAPPETFLESLNALREQSGNRPLRLSSSLVLATQTLLDKLIETGKLEDPTRSGEETAAVLAASGYEAKTFVEAMAQSAGDPHLILQRWTRDSPETLEALLADELRDLGVGVAEAEGTLLYYLIAALSIDDYHSPIVADLEDLAAVRKTLLEMVNAERRRARAPLLRLQQQLNRTAQGYAEDMLARDFYGHESPEGTTVMDRAQAEGYRGRTAGENLANGAESIDEVMRGWMESKGHRENILSRVYREVGFGVAIGKKTDGYRILWVQCFGKPPR